MQPTREEIIRCRLRNMAGWAKERRDFLAEPPKEWKEDWYIRIGGDGFRAVSVSDKRPQLGFNSRAKREISRVSDDFDVNIEEGPGRGTPEKRIQSLLIRHAINNQLEMHKLLCLDASVYSKLLIALDEVALGDRKNPPKLVCDILAAGVYEGNAYPVLIELKSSNKASDLDRLFEQLENFKREMKTFSAEFRPLLEACVGVEVDCSKIGRIMILPAPEHDKRSSNLQTECDKNHVSVIEYDKNTLQFKPWLVYPPTPFKKVS